MDAGLLRLPLCTPGAASELHSMLRWGVRALVCAAYALAGAGTVQRLAPEGAGKSVYVFVRVKLVHFVIIVDKLLESVIDVAVAYILQRFAVQVENDQCDLAAAHHAKLHAFLDYAILPL